jgi:hypothetical protein
MSTEHQPEQATPERRSATPAPETTVVPDSAAPAAVVEARRLASPGSLAHSTARELRRTDVLRAHGALGNRHVAGMLAQRQGTEQPAVPDGDLAGAEGAAAAGLVVDDGVATLSPGQMRKSEFLAQLRTAVAATVEEVLAGTPWAGLAGPELERRLATYRGLDAAALERTLRREVPAAAGAASAADLIPLVCNHVRATLRQQLPAPGGGMAAAAGSALSAAAGAVSAAASSVAGAVGSALSAIGGLFFKRRPDAPATTGDPAATRARLGTGQALDGSVRSGMETAFGRDFSDVRVHADGQAAGVAAELGARAITVGQDVAFGAGEYRPGTPVGDALIAHELAHVAQQEGAAAAGPQAKGPDGAEGMLEEDADRSAVAAVAMLWGGAKAGAGEIARSALPQLRTGLRLQRCNGGGSTNPPAPAVVPPVPKYVVPFDRTPLSAPGEQIILRGEFTHASPAEFQLDYTGVGGKFDSATGGTSKTIAGLTSGNVYFFIDAAWNGTDPVTVKLEVKKTADNSVVQTVNWTFGKKSYYPTTITQNETENERPLPSSYTYKLGPDRGADGRDDYLHQTILEKFGQRTCNISLADLKPEWKAAHPDVSTPEAITAHFFGTSSNNGTFTVSAGDRIADRHSGFRATKAQLEAALVTMKEVYVDLPQTYEAQPGVALGNYTVRRIMKPDGTLKLKKWKT